MPFSLIPAWGAMVTNWPWRLGGVTGQFEGRWRFTGPIASATMFLLGVTLWSETGDAGVAGRVGAVGVVPAAVKVAPFLWFKEAHWPDFAPCAISSAE